MLSSLWPPRVLGGAELYAGRLAAELRERGHEVGAVTLGIDADGVVGRAPAWPYALDTWAGKPRWQRALFQARDVYDVAAAVAVAKAVRDFRPDVVHSHAVQGMSMAALSEPSRNRVPHVHTVHDYWLLCRRSTMTRPDGTSCATRCTSCRAVGAVRATVGRHHFASLVLAPSVAVAAEHRASPWLRDRVRVVPQAVEKVPVAPRRPPTPPVRFGYLGQLAPIKGITTLLDAFSRLPGGAELAVAGRGPLEDTVRKAPGVRFLGWIDARGRDEFFGSVDCLVVPSEWREPAPLVVTEARARGVPVIGAAVGGIPEMVDERSRPLLFAAGDADALAAAMTRFAADPASFAPGDATGTVSWEEHVDLVLGAYQDVGARP